MTKRMAFITPTVLLAAFTLAAAPSFAQEKAHGRENRSGQSGQQSGQQAAQPSGGQSRERAQPRAEAPRARTESPRPQGGAAPAVAPRQERPQTQQPQAQQPSQGQRAVPRQDAPRDNRGSDNRANENRANENRTNDSRRAESRQGDDRRNEGRAVPRGNVEAPRYQPRYVPRYSSPRVYAPRSYYRPYVFRPRFSIGLGIFAGYSVPYTYSYSYPIVVYGYRAPRERVMIVPGSPYYGGVSLELTPSDADVFVDGQYAGRVEDFDGTTQPLTLATGGHEIEVQASGYEPMTIHVEIQPGQIIPYRGDLRPY
jgi:hypothetical protein